jgi:leucyl-tRNA synthetase
MIQKSATPQNILLFSREMRKSPTKAEAYIWKLLRNNQFGIRFRRQFPLGGHILDFYCPSLYLAIEVDGGIHSTEQAKQNDNIRDLYLRNEHRVTTLRFSNEDALKRTDSVLMLIEKEIKRIRNLS